MPQYKTHAAINLCFALPLFLIIIYLFLDPTHTYLLIFSSAFIYTSLFMSPDMDVARKIKWYSLRGFLSLPFRSYSRVFKHRGVSHSLLLGSLSRIVWLTLFTALILYACNGITFSTHHIMSYYTHYKKELLYGFFGICSADVVHILTDKIL